METEKQRHAFDKYISGTECQFLSNCALDLREIMIAKKKRIQVTDVFVTCQNHRYYETYVKPWYWKYTLTHGWLRGKLVGPELNNVTEGLSGYQPDESELSSSNKIISGGESWTSGLRVDVNPIQSEIIDTFHITNDNQKRYCRNSWYQSKLH